MGRLACDIGSNGVRVVGRNWRDDWYGRPEGMEGISMPGSCRTIWWQLALGDVEEQSERAVHRLGILEDLSHVGIEKHDIGAGLELLMNAFPALRRRNRTPVSCRRH